MFINIDSKHMNYKANKDLRMVNQVKESSEMNYFTFEVGTLNGSLAFLDVHGFIKDGDELSVHVSDISTDPGHYMQPMAYVGSGEDKIFFAVSSEIGKECVDMAKNIIMKEYEEKKMGRSNKNDMIDEMVLHTTLYEIYKESWMYENVSPAERLDSFRRYKAISACEDNMYKSYDDYLWDNGAFGSGSLYVCFGEFMDNEYEDREYIESLIDTADIEPEYKEKILASYDYYQQEEEKEL